MNQISAEDGDGYAEMRDSLQNPLDKSSRINDSRSSSLQSQGFETFDVRRASPQANKENSLIVEEPIEEVTEYTQTTEYRTASRDVAQVMTQQTAQLSMGLDEATIIEKHALIESLAPEILSELDTIDHSIQRIKDLIRPHTNLNRAVDVCPAFSLHFDEYKNCLQYQRTRLCQLLENDLNFWNKKLEETNLAKSLLQQQIEELEKQEAEESMIKSMRQSLFASRLSKPMLSATLRHTAMLGEQVHKGKIDFHWPRKEEMQVFKTGEPFELSHLIMKGEPGKYLKGIGLGFTNGFQTPFSQAQVYSNYTAPTVAYPLDLEQGYSKIFAKVANSGDQTIITAIRLGHEGSEFALHHEWKKIGQWQHPLVLQPNEHIVGFRGYYGPNDSIKSLGFVLMSYDDD